MPTRIPLAIVGVVLFALSATYAQAQFSAGGFDHGSNSPVTESSHSQASEASLNKALTMPDAPVPGSAKGLPSATGANDEPVCGIERLGRCIADLGEDEKGMLTSPSRMGPKDAYWLVPLGVATGLAIAYDPGAARAVGVDASRTQTSNRIADFGSFLATGAEGGGIYFIGLAKHDPKLVETGRLGAEAVIDSGSVTLLAKLATNRQRPRQGDGQGDFWPYGTAHWEWDSSFPSDHATASMALARVIAGEYPHWYVMASAYGFAEAVGVSRILANQHFPSDVLVGQAIGFLAGGYVLNHRARYRPGAQQTLARKMMESVTPVADPKSHAFGASMQISLGR